MTKKPVDPPGDFSGTTVEPPNGMNGDNHVQRTGPAKIATTRVCYDSYKSSQSARGPTRVLLVPGPSREFHHHWLELRPYCAVSAFLA
ncbi:hypothetical protein MRX96_005417 [Rhipicephalus microplus]